MMISEFLREVSAVDADAPPDLHWWLVLCACHVCVQPTFWLDDATVRCITTLPRHIFKAWKANQLSPGAIFRRLKCTWSKTCPLRCRPRLHWQTARDATRPSYLLLLDKFVVSISFGDSILSHTTFWNVAAPPDSFNSRSIIQSPKTPPSYILNDDKK